MPSNIDKHSVEGEEQIRLCNYVDVYRNERIHDDLDFMQATAKGSQVERFTLRAQDVIVTKDSEAANDIGVPAFVPHDMPGVVCGYHLAILRPSSPLIVGGYLAWVLRSREVQAYYETAATGISRYALGIGDLGMTPVPLPSKEVQVRITNFLDEQTARIDALIAGKEKLAATLEEWYSAELQTLCCGRDRASERTGNTWIAAIPKGWRLVRLKHLVRGIEQGWSPECEARLAEDDEWGVLKAGAANRGIYSGNEEHKALPSSLTPLPSLEVKPGDVLITRASGSADLVGSFAYVYSTRPKLMLSDKNFRLIFGDIPTLNTELLAWACNTHPIREQIRQFVSGAEGLAKNIGSGNLREIWLPVPPKDEQEGIVRSVRALREQRQGFQAHLIEHLARLREYRSSLISAAVTGQIDINKISSGGGLT